MSSIKLVGRFLQHCIQLAGIREQFATQQHDLTFLSPLKFFQVSRPLATLSLAQSLRDLIEACFACFARFTRKTRGKLISIEEVDLKQVYNTISFENRHQFA